MTGEQSRRLKVGDRVCHEGNHDAGGTVIAVHRSGVKIKIKWATGLVSEIMHNDMGKIEIAK